MTYGQKRRFFTRLVSLNLIPYILNYQGGVYDCAIKWVHRCNQCPVGHANSLHKHTLAVDVDLYRVGADGRRIWLSDTADHEPFGAFWLGLHTLTRWGGVDGADGNHYSIVHAGMTY